MTTTGYFSATFQINGEKHLVSIWLEDGIYRDSFIIEGAEPVVLGSGTCGNITGNLSSYVVVSQGIDKKMKFGHTESSAQEAVIDFSTRCIVTGGSEGLSSASITVAVG